MPEGTFKKKDIRACVVVMRKTKKRKPTVYYTATYNKKWEINYAGIIDSKRIVSGCWQNSNNDFSISSDFMIFRGKICSSMFQDDGQSKIYHCSSLIEDGRWKPLVKKTNEVSSTRVTEVGDVLVNRIGKKAGYWCICNKKGYYVSDCIIVIKNPSEKCIRQLEKKSVEGRLNIPIRGVSTQYVTENDIQLLLSVCS